MAKRGTVPTRENVKRLRGTARNDRKPVQAATGAAREAAKALANPPHWLQDEAKREWRRIVRELAELGTLGKADRAALTGYCVAFGVLERATRTLAAEGETVSAPSGYFLPHPAVARQKAALLIVKGFVSELGLSPASRARLQLPEPEDPDDPIAELLRRKDERGRPL
jgi:P27 family predicted phage terminase small subunit